MAQNDLFGPLVQVAAAGVAAAGRPRLALRLMASLLYLKHAYKLSAEELVERWAENVVWQHFSGMTFYEPRLPCDATQVGRFRSAIGEAGVEELLKATIDTAVASKAIRPAEFERVVVDTTVQQKAIAHPVDSRLLEIARHKVVAAAKRRHRAQADQRPRRARACVAGPAATPAPNSSSVCARWSNASARSWGSCCARWGARSRRPARQRH